MRSLLYKELRWLRRNIATVLLVPVALPAIVDRLTVFEDGEVRYDGPIDGETTAHERYMTSLGLA